MHSLAVIFTVLVSVTFATGAFPPAQRSSLDYAIPSTPINHYCNFSVYQFWDDFNSVELSCGNTWDSPLDDLSFDWDTTNFYEAMYLQPGRNLSNAVQDALQQVKRRFHNGTLFVDVEVDGYHPRSPQIVYSKILAVLEIGSGWVRPLRGEDQVRIRVSRVGLKIQPDVVLGKQLSVMAVHTVIPVTHA